ncbi:ATPase, P-type, HAD superfamily, subfamily IC [Caulochytrium protostelioides]|nr:ATPase, P-type, HAD superfamily, subfamily IC [Caulochytrium protostelioides]
MASSGLRVLGFALRRVARADADAIVRAKKETEAEQDLAFIGLIGLIDPPKQGVKESIATCRRAGINVIMITGDHVATASAIARQLGIMDLADATRSRSLKGSDLDAMSDEHLAAMSPFPVVFARVSPDNKLKIVKTLQSMKYSVAMTGDGVNDAPAIKHADVGVAMGISGTEITKQAADIVLADDNFSTIVEAVKEGRKVYDNIRKFIIYLLSCNFAEIMLFLISSICGFDLPFSTIQILWANLIIDIPPSTAIGLEPQEKGIMDRKPRPKNAGIMSLLDTLLIFCQGMTQAVITLVVYVLCMRGKIGGVVTTRQIESLPFAVLGLLQLNQSLMSRSIYGSVWRTGITGNRWLLFAWVFAFSFLVMGIYIPKWNDWLELEPINGIGWGVIFLCVAIHIIVIELMIKPTMRFLLARGGIHLPRLPFLHKKKKNRF